MSFLDMNSTTALMSNTSMGRMEMLQKQLDNSCSLQSVLCQTQANLELLRIKSKNYHWNVTGSGFEGVHRLFDDLSKYASSQSDRIAERIRYYNCHVSATAHNYTLEAWFQEGNCSLSQDGMLKDMCMTLGCIDERLCKFLCGLSDCPVDQNIIEEILEQINKFQYFVKSNLSCDLILEQY